MGLRPRRLRALPCFESPPAHVWPTMLGRGLSVVSFALAMFAGLLGAWRAAAQDMSPAIPVDGQVRVSYSGLVLNRATNTFDTIAKISNVGTTPVLAPISLLVTAITSASVQLANAAGTTSAGLPYVEPAADRRQP